MARQIARIRGKFSGESGSSQANRRSPDFSWATTCSATGRPAAAASSARSCGFRSKVGYDGIQPIRALCAMRSAVVRPPKRPCPVRADSVSAPKWS